MLKKQVGKAVLFLEDGLHSEDLAMVQALYSRSGESVETHLEKVRKVGSGKFVEKYVVGYGHKSIADCGSTTLFFENVSILAAKAIQDWSLYSGQETSTRYIDMANRPVVNPIGQTATTIIDRWERFYAEKQAPVLEWVRSQYPRKSSEKEDTYERAIKARTFDILRGFLPAGKTTQLSWHTNLRQASDHLGLLIQHPLQEVRELASGALALLREQYPSSFGEKLYPDRVVWEASTYGSYKPLPPKKWDIRSTIDDGALKPYYEMLITRPRGSALPAHMAELGSLSFRGELDYGSWRDIQRHRNGVCRVPKLTTDLGFESWYLEQLGPMRAEAEALISEQVELISSIEDDVASQYLIPLGFKVPFQVTYGLPAAVYVLELRSGKAVHPTLRKAIHNMIGDLAFTHPEVLLHVDMDPDDWDVRRGDQTITAR
jgi:thymidylate synthase ThyX